jgi:hypothetical protein
MKAIGFQSQISHDGSLVQIIMTAEGGETVTLTTDANGLGTIVQNLGANRAKMKPAHPKTLDPYPLFSDVTRQTSVTVGIPKKANGEMYLAILHPGYGWLCFPMKPQAGGQVAEKMAAVAIMAMDKTPIVGLDGKPLTIGPRGP